MGKWLNYTTGIRVIRTTCKGITCTTGKGIIHTAGKGIIRTTWKGVICTTGKEVIHTTKKGVINITDLYRKKRSWISFVLYWGRICVACEWECSCKFVYFFYMIMYVQVYVFVYLPSASVYIIFTSVCIAYVNAQSANRTWKYMNYSV